MIYMFNELSVSPVGSMEQVREVMKTFVNTYIAAKDAGIDELRIHEKSIPNLYDLNLSDDYNVSNWLKDGRVNSDLQDNFRLIVTTTPLVSQEDIERSEEYATSEFFKTIDKKDYQVWGLGATYLYDTI